MNKCRRTRLKLTQTSPLCPSIRRHATPHHTNPLFSLPPTPLLVLRTVLQVPSKQPDMILCLPAPPPPSSYDLWRRETQQSFRVFFPSSSSKNGTIVVCFCHLLAAVFFLRTKDNGLFTAGFVSVCPLIQEAPVVHYQKCINNIRVKRFWGFLFWKHLFFSETTFALFLLIWLSR